MTWTENVQNRPLQVYSSTACLASALFSARSFRVAGGGAGGVSGEREPESRRLYGPAGRRRRDADRVPGLLPGVEGRGGMLLSCDLLSSLSVSHLRAASIGRLDLNTFI